ncbi:MAG: methyl-accepting chemotaxis protein [Sneathiella sp.]
MLKLFKKTIGKKANSNDGTKKYSKFGIGFRLTGAFSVVTVLTIVISGLSWVSIGVLTDAQSNTIEQKVPAIALALRLANDTANIAATTPQLRSSQTDKARQESVSSLGATINIAKTRLEELNSFIEGDAALQRIEESIQTLEPLLSQLDGHVKERLRLTTLRLEIMTQLAQLRKTLKTGAQPLLLPLRIKMFDNADTFDEMIEALVEDAKSGTIPEYDFEELHQTNRNVLRFQEDVLSFQSSGYLLLSLLAEGTLADNNKDVSELSSSFLSSLSSMASPLSKLVERDNNKAVQKLEQLFETLLVMGAKGTDNQLVFKIRTAELNAIEAADKILTQSRLIAENLSADANTFVSSIEESVQLATSQNSSLAEQTKITLAIAAIISVIIAIAIGWLYISRNIVSRLMMMVESARKLSEGDLQSSIYREGNDEIARLGYAIVDFRDTARKAQAAREETDIQNKNREEEKELQRNERIEVDRKAQEEQSRQADEAETNKRAEMNKLAVEFEGSVKRLVGNFSVATTEMTQISGSMSSSAGDTTSLTQNVVTASRNSSSSINSVAAATEELSSSINEISRQVGQAASIAGDAVREAERSNVMMTSLNDAAAKIGDVVGLISDIAGQTNLLALNATIEAARAGDAGKGFAVVASEVKNLATQTAKATEDITEQIKTVQAETSQAAMAIGGISTTIGRINEIATTISAAVEEQGAATSEISRSVQQAADSAQEVTQNIAAVNDTATSTGQSAVKVQNVAEKLVREAGDLDVEVDRFLGQVKSS